MNRSILIIILVSSVLVLAAAMEFLSWSPEKFANLKSISDTTAIFFISIGLAMTYVIYLYAKKKGWWNVNSKYNYPNSKSAIALKNKFYKI
ncbi:hypothetical protein [Nitrosopumilus sp.]|uniref:hypothetical protein n=1 Tax=Nitrosopumilus sp. TaxID=2024843 RepID=UPI003B5B0227